MVDIPGKVVPGIYNLSMQLPEGCYSVARAVKLGSGEDNQLAGNPVASGVGTPKEGTTAYNEWNFSVTFNNEGTKSRFYIELSNFHVASGASGDLNVSFKVSPGSPFSNDDKVKIATVGSGSVTVSIDEVNGINSRPGGGELPGRPGGGDVPGQNCGDN